MRSSAVDALKVSSFMSVLFYVYFIHRSLPLLFYKASSHSDGLSYLNAVLSELRFRCDTGDGLKKPIFLITKLSNYIAFFDSFQFLLNIFYSLVFLYLCVKRAYIAL